jgi:uncharacterized membrane protein YphA (DoxX/SURF4 family)
LVRRSPLAVSRRYYPGFLGAFFLVLLRVAIGWHFLYEGLEKLDSQERGGKPFSAETYLRFSTGPFATYFRGMFDANSLVMLDEARLKIAWNADVEAIGNHFKFDDTQRGAAQDELQKKNEWVKIWFEDPSTTETRIKYFHELGEVQKVEQDPGALKNRREWASTKRRDLDADRKGLIKDLETHTTALRDSVTKLATKEQVAASGPYVVSVPTYYVNQGLAYAGMGKPNQLRPSTIELINFTTTWGLIVMGACLMLGLYSRLSALAGAVFLAQIYLSMPPWPGLPANPLAEGHYLIVSKNLIEMIALLALMCLPTGQWIGLDALLFGWIRRRRERRAEERAQRARERERSRSRQPVS